MSPACRRSRTTTGEPVQGAQGGAVPGLLRHDENAGFVSSTLKSNDSATTSRPFSWAGAGRQDARARARLASLSRSRCCRRRRISTAYPPERPSPPLHLRPPTSHYAANERARILFGGDMKSVNISLIIFLVVVHFMVLLRQKPFWQLLYE